MKIKNIVIYIFVPIFFSYFSLIYMNYKENKNYIFDSTVSNQIKLVQSYKARIDERIYHKKKLLEETAKFIGTKGKTKDYALIKEVLRIVARTGGFSEVYIGYGVTNQTVSSDSYEPPDDETYIVKQRPWYQAVLSTYQTRITAPYLDFKLKKNVISIATPIFKNGVLESVLTGDLELDILQKDIFLLFPLKEGSVFLMTNDANILDSVDQELDLADHDIKNFLLTLAKKEHGTERFFVKNKSYIFVYDTLANSDWSFVSVLNEEKIYEKLYQKTLDNFFIFIFLAVFGICIIVWVAFAQNKLYKNKHLLSLFAKNSIGGVLITDKEGLIVFINKAFEKIFSLKPKDFIGKNINQLSYVLYNKNSTTRYCFDAIKEHPNQSIFTEIQIDNLFYRMQMIPLFENQSRVQGLIITVYDITHEVELESQKQKQEQILIHNGKMAALGEMIGAISHQWTQPLNTLLLSISDLEDIIATIDVPKNTQNRIISHFNRSRINIDLMDETITIFKNFYKEDFLEKSFDIVDIVEDVLFIYKQQTLMHGIELEIDYVEKYHYLKSHPTYLKQILMNIIANAKDELIKVKQLDLSFHAKIKIIIVEEANQYIINVEDNGRGISEEKKEHIFEPFFTTKGNDGMGMGLYLCKLLFENKMQGDIVLSNLSNPTKFSILLFK